MIIKCWYLLYRWNFWALCKLVCFTWPILIEFGPWQVSKSVKSIFEFLFKIFFFSRQFQCISWTKIHPSPFQCISNYQPPTPPAPHRTFYTEFYSTAFYFPQLFSTSQLVCILLYPVMVIISMLQLIILSGSDNYGVCYEC